jgi:hypothetical protein
VYLTLEAYQVLGKVYTNEIQQKLIRQNRLVNNVAEIGYNKVIKVMDMF